MISRRQFVQTTAAIAAVPFVSTNTHRLDVDELSLNCSPSRQALMVEVATVLTAVTRFDFTPRLIGHDEGRRLARMLRDKFGRIQVEARSAFAGSPRDVERLALEWLVGDGASQRLGWLAAFVRSDAFQIRRTYNFIILSVEV